MNSTIKNRDFENFIQLSVRVIIFTLNIIRFSLYPDIRPSLVLCVNLLHVLCMYFSDFAHYFVAVTELCFFPREDKK